MIVKRIIILSLLIVASFGIGAFVGQRLLAKPAAPVEVYKDTAIGVANALQDEEFLKELAAFLKESKSSSKKFIFAIFKNLRLSEPELKDLQLCVAQYQELNDMFDGVNIELVKKAWQNVAWEIIDGQIMINKSSMNDQARKLAGLDTVIAPRIKKFASLNAQWSEKVEKIINAVNLLVTENKSALFFPYINFNASMYKILKKYPRVQELSNQIYACMQWQYTKQLFMLALKDELVNRMEQWLPKAWPYAKEGIQGLGELFDGMVTKQIKFVSKLAASTDDAFLSDNTEEE